MRTSRLLIPLTSLSLLVGAMVGPANPASAAPAATGATMATSVPPAPASVSARPLGRQSLALAWPQTAGATTYQLFARDAVTGTIVGPVAAAGTRGEIGGLTVGRQYVPGILAQNAAGSSAIRWGTAVTVLANAAPAAVGNLAVAASTTSTLATVRWTAATSGIQPDSYAVVIVTPQGAAVGAPAGCDYPCTSRTVQGLEPGTYLALVAPLSWSGGVGAWKVSAAFNVVDGCATGGACVTITAGSDRGAAALLAQGLNAGLAGVDPSQLQPLKLRNVRGAGSWTYATARTIGAKMTWVLSNAWYDLGMRTTGSVPRPWADWTYYSNWAAGTALGIKLNRPVSYFDVQNEPYAGYFPDDPNPAVDPDRVAEQLQYASQGLRSGDPTAKVVGPSFGSYSETQMRMFLDSAVRRGLRLDAVDWHELAPSGGSVDRIPVDILEHVAQVRTMIAQRPSLGSPEIHINEYTSTATSRLAGWGVGFISALEQSDVTLAMRTCWGDSDCAGGAELIDAATGATLAPYWVHRYYADQTGRRLVSTSTNANVSSFATRDGDTVRVMVGRHQTCVAAINSTCSQNLATGPAFDVPVTITGLPAGASRKVVVQRIPATTGPVSGPTTISTRTVTVASNGSLPVTLPAVADGEAWTVTVTP